MSKKAQAPKINSPKVTSEFITTMSSTNQQIHQSYSANNKTFQGKAYNPKINCTCSQRLKTIQAKDPRCTCTFYKNGLMNSYKSEKTEKIKSRFEHVTTPVKYNMTSNQRGIVDMKVNRSQSYRNDTFSSFSSNSKLVCTCKSKRSETIKINKSYSELNRSVSLAGQKTENLQILPCPAPELTAQYVQNLAIIQHPKQIKILVPINKNETAYTNKIELKGVSPEKAKESKEIIKEKKKEKEEEKKEEEKIIVNDDYNKVKSSSYSRRIRANIIRVQPSEEKETEDMSLDFDVLKKINKYEGEFKYKYLVNQSIEFINKSIEISNEEEKKEQNVEYNYKNHNNQPSETELHININYNQDIEELPRSPEIKNYCNPDIIQDVVQAPEDSPYPNELVRKEKLIQEKSEENIVQNDVNYGTNEEIQNYQNKNVNDNNYTNNEDSPIEKDYINMKIEEEQNVNTHSGEMNQNEEIKDEENVDNIEQHEEAEVNEEENPEEQEKEQEELEEQEQEEEEQGEEQVEEINNEEEEEEQIPEQERENENEHEVETYEIEENNENPKEKNNINDENDYYYNELGLEEKEVHSGKEGTGKKKIVESQEMSGDKEEADGGSDEQDHIEAQLEQYVEEQKNKDINEESERKRKIKVYNLVENKQRKIVEQHDPDSVVVYMKSSVQTSNSKQDKEKNNESSPNQENSSDGNNPNNS